MQTKAQFHNLNQNKHLDMDDPVFLERWEAYKGSQVEDLEVDEERINELTERFSQDYDLTDMNINDTLSLQQIVRETVEIEELQKLLSQARANNELTKVTHIDRVIKNKLQIISLLQQDLDITRKSRQDSKGESLHEYLPIIQKKARSFLKERLAYIYCPECRMLVCNAWFTDWEDDNQLSLTCPREECKHRFTVTSEELTKNRNNNIDGVLHV